MCIVFENKTGRIESKKLGLGRRYVTQGNAVLTSVEFSNKTVRVICFCCLVNKSFGNLRCQNL